MLYMLYDIIVLQPSVACDYVIVTMTMSCDMWHHAKPSSSVPL